MARIYDYTKFVKNRYSDWYYDIVNHALTENREKNDGYYEIHHILPRSLFPEYQKEQWNLVLLTAREHLICHLLLRKFTIGNDFIKMNRAAQFMCARGKVTSRVYEAIRSNLSHSEETKEKMAKSATGKPKSIEARAKMSAAKKGKPAIGKPFMEGHIPWNKGRNLGPAWNRGLSGNFLGGKMTDESREKIKLARARNKHKKLACPHCSKEIDPPNYARFHGNNCKFKDTLVWL